MKWFFYRLKYDLLYKFGRKYKYCHDCLMKYKLTKTFWKYKRCGDCSHKFSNGRQG